MRTLGEVMHDYLISVEVGSEAIHFFYIQTGVDKATGASDASGASDGQL